MARGQWGPQGRAPDHGRSGREGEAQRRHQEPGERSGQDATARRRIARAEPYAPCPKFAAKVTLRAPLPGEPNFWTLKNTPGELPGVYVKYGGEAATN